MLCYALLILQRPAPNVPQSHDHIILYDSAAVTFLQSYEPPAVYCSAAIQVSTSTGPQEATQCRSKALKICAEMGRGNVPASGIVSN
jgi:hypothetical protein